MLDYATRRKIWSSCIRFTSQRKVASHQLISIVEDIVTNNIQGAMVECGVWRGGSIMIIIMTLMELGITDREIYLYDTFAGMPAPTKHDWHKTKNDAIKKYNAAKVSNALCNWCYVPLDAVKENIYKLGYPKNFIHFVAGKVEDTIPTTIPENISLLRLDMDWYEAYKHALEYLFPLVLTGGTLINDDYYYWQGCKKAVDEYFVTHRLNGILRVDLPIHLQTI